jgi:hypothetical protein
MPLAIVKHPGQCVAGVLTGKRITARVAPSHTLLVPLAHARSALRRDLQRPVSSLPAPVRRARASMGGSQMGYDQAYLAFATDIVTLRALPPAAASCTTPTG